MYVSWRLAAGFWCDINLKEILIAVIFRFIVLASKVRYALLI